HLTLAVSNLQRSLTFWRDLLGLQLHAEWDTGAYLTCGDLWICLSYDVFRNYVAPQESDYTHYAFSLCLFYPSHAADALSPLVAHV
ncbi:VOC family protein, partial [Klebsiella pneumoniae]|nr:VOC family protein [Klebsiella pneumoniae]